MIEEISREFEVKRTVLEPFVIEKRVIYPIVDVLSYHTGLNIISVSPVALITEEDGDKYVIQLSHKEIDENELFKVLSSFKDNIG